MYVKSVVTVVWVFAVHLSRSATDDGGRNIAGPAVDAVAGVIQTVSAGLGRPDGSAAAAAVETQETTSKPATAHRPEVTTGSCSAPEVTTGSCSAPEPWDHAGQLAEFNQATDDRLADEPQLYGCSRYVEEFCNRR